MTRKTLGLVTVMTAVAVLATAGSAFASTVYNSVPIQLPGNVPSLGYEATSTSEYGGAIHLAGSDRKAKSLTFMLSSWGCQTRPGGVCTTSPGATFPVAIRARIYDIGPGGSPGAVLAQNTQTLPIKYRPSASNKCTGGRWYSNADKSCYNGKLVRRTIKFNKEQIPSDVIVSLAYNTTHYGYNPIGPAPCTSTPAGCGYDSLNVALDGAAPRVGSQPYPDDAWWNTTVAGFYCDGGAGGTGTFRLDAGCWTGYQPMLRLDARR